MNEKLKRLMRRRPPRIRRRSKPGASPGTLSIDPAAPKSKMQMIAYGPDGIVERDIHSPEQIKPFLEEWPVVWLNVNGLGDATALEKLGEIFHIHSLALEDIVNVHQQPKLEEYDDQLFLVARMISHEGRLHTEQLSLHIGEGFVVSFQEKPGDCFSQVRQRIRKSGPRIRLRGADYLAYALIDAVLDAYFPVLEVYAETLDELEEAVTQHFSPISSSQIHAIRSDLLLLRRAMWPLREALAGMVRSEEKLIEDQTRPFLRDCQDHAAQILDLITIYRELTTDLRDLHNTVLSNRMNQTMRMLTVIATIFMPLSFVAGLYGMNFNTELSQWNMPELNWVYGYPYVWCLMGGIALFMAYLFWRKGWFGGRDLFD